MRLLHPEIKFLWYRNSFCFDYWVFLKSDIDITIVFEQANQKLIKEVTHTHTFLRRLQPIIGELIIFSEFHQHAILKCVNYFEFMRDPALFKTYHRHKAPDHYEKIVFLHKFIVANWKQKETIDAQRPDKILYVMSLLDLGNTKPFINLIDVLANLINTDPIEFRKDYIREIESIFQNVPSGSAEVNPTVYVLFYNKFCYYKSDIKLNYIEKKIIEKTISWELWGLFSYNLTQDSKIHLKNLIAHLGHIAGTEITLASIGQIIDLELEFIH